MSFAVLCGMPQEQAILRAAFRDVSVPVLSGTDKNNLATLIPADCDHILVSGLCGGLAPGFNIADVVVATSVVDGSGNVYATDAVWNLAIEDYGTLAGERPMALKPCTYYSSGVLDQGDTAQQRAALFAATGAQCIDDEAYWAIQFATGKPIALTIIRSVSDDWTETLPLAARGAIMNADGSTNLNYLLRELATEPAYQTIDLFKVAVDFNSSLAALQAAINFYLPAITNS